MALGSGPNKQVFRATKAGLTLKVAVDSTTGKVLDARHGTQLTWAEGWRWAEVKRQLYGQGFVIENLYSE